MAGKVADGCTNAAEDLAEAHLEDQVNTICDDLYLVLQTPELEEALKSLLWSRKQLEELQSYYTRSSDSIQSANVPAFINSFPNLFIGRAVEEDMRRNQDFAVC